MKSLVLESIDLLFLDSLHELSFAIESAALIFSYELQKHSKKVELFSSECLPLEVIEVSHGRHRHNERHLVSRHLSYDAEGEIV